MSSYVEEIHEDIEHETHYCDVRDLLGAWRERSASGPVDLDSMLARFPDLSDRVMTLVETDGDLVYDHVGRQVSALFNHLLTGLFLSKLDNPRVLPFRNCYHRAVREGVPAFCVQHRLGSSALGANERLILPGVLGKRRGLLIYVRDRETTNDLLRAVFHASSDSITIIEAVRDSNGQIIDFRTVAANAETARRLGTTADALIGQFLTVRFPFAKPEGVFDRFVRAIETQMPDALDLSLDRDSVTVHRHFRVAPWGERLTVTGIDIEPMIQASRALEHKNAELTEANALLERRALDLKATNEALATTAVELRSEIARNKVLERELTRLARHDGLTGLPNRGYFETRFKEALDRAAKTGESLALCVIDVDHFKDINDRFGHGAGDHVLRDVARRLRETLGKHGFLGRMGGDEFAAVITDCPHDGAAITMAEQLVVAGSLPATYERQEMPLSLSVGVAMFPDDGATTRELTAAADIAVYRAKREGRGRPVLFDPSLRFQIERTHRLIARVAEAIDRREVVPHYQPLLDLRTGQIIGFEALARWRHPERGLLSPSQFAEALDIPDIAQALTRRIVDDVADDLRDWAAMGLPAHVSVNVTAFDLRRPDFASNVRNRLAERGLSSHQLAIEVTETTVLSHESDRIAETLGELRRLGFSVALDDFGTGFASLSHLLKLPVNSLKIDRSFVAGIETEPKTAAVVRSLVSLARSLDLDIVAEGIETRQQLDLLRGFGCHLVQGFLFASAMPACDVPRFGQTFRSADPIRALRAHHSG